MPGRVAGQRALFPSSQLAYEKETGAVQLAGIYPPPAECQPAASSLFVPITRGSPGASQFLLPALLPAHPGSHPHPGLSGPLRPSAALCGPLQ